MKAIFVLSMELPEPEDAIAVVKHLDPPSIPHFAGDLRVAIGDVADRVEKWLDEDEEDL